MIPRAWRVHWLALDNTPAGYLDFPQRCRARGFVMIRRAAGYACRIEAIF